MYVCYVYLNKDQSINQYPKDKKVHETEL